MQQLLRQQRTAAFSTEASAQLLINKSKSSSDNNSNKYNNNNNDDDDEDEDEDNNDNGRAFRGESPVEEAVKRQVLRDMVVDHAYLDQYVKDHVVDDDHLRTLATDLLKQMGIGEDSADFEEKLDLITG